MRFSVFADAVFVAFVARLLRDVPRPDRDRR
jgi:hypothetical protein